MIHQAQKELRKLAKSETAKVLIRFFKTGPGEYGEGDQFLGIKVPATRQLVKRYIHLELEELRPILYSEFHEERLFALLVLEAQYSKNNQDRQTAQRLINFYLNNRLQVNNWDLVDLTASKILGHYCFHKNQIKILHALSKSERHWDRRIAIVATYYYIKQNDFAATFQFAKQNLSETEDLMHKATGWMLREVGKRDTKALMGFIEKFGKKMPRTMLRYAIEKFSETKRLSILRSTKST